MIRVKPDGAGYSFAIIGQIENYEQYKSAVAQLTARPNTRDRYAGIHVARETIIRLRAEGFNVEITPEAQFAMRREIQQEAELAAQANGVAIDNGLRSYQIEDAQRLATAKTGFLLANQPGTGKTATALSAIPAGARVVVVAPLSASGVWVREAERWRPSFRAHRVTRRGFQWPEPNEIRIISYDSLPYAENIPAPPKGVLWILDEAHAVKNHLSKRFVNLNSLIIKTRKKGGGIVWALTGTPITNKPMDLYSITKICGFNALAFGRENTLGRFRDLVGARKVGWDWYYDNDKIDGMVATCLAPYMSRRLKSDVIAELPPKTVEYHYIDLKASERRLLDVFDPADVEDILNPGTIKFQEYATVRAKLALALTHAAEELIEELEELEEPTVVFSAHVEPINIIGKRDGWGMITGSVLSTRRSIIEKEFQDGHLKGVAATIGAGGTALTLTRANRMIVVSLDWSQANNEQAFDRIHRIGQSNPVIITVLIADHPICRAVERRLAEKIVRQERIIDPVAKIAKVSTDLGLEFLDDPSEAAAETSRALEQLEADRERRMRRYAYCRRIRGIANWLDEKRYAGICGSFQPDDCRGPVTSVEQAALAKGTKDFVDAFEAADQGLPPGGWSTLVYLALGSEAEADDDAITSVVDAAAARGLSCDIVGCRVVLTDGRKEAAFVVTAQDNAADAVAAIAESF